MRILKTGKDVNVGETDLKRKNCEAQSSCAAHNVDHRRFSAVFGGRRTRTRTRGRRSRRGTR